MSQERESTTRRQSAADRPVIGVLGGGSWGTGIAHLLAANGNEVLLWMRDGDVAASINEKRINPRYLPNLEIARGVRATLDLEEVCGGAHLLYGVVPSQSFRSVMRDMGPFLRADHFLISASKGFEIETFRRMTEIIREETCVRRIGVLSGPNISREILEGQPAATVIASRYREVVDAGIASLHSPRFRVYSGTDVVGVEIAAALKNVVAICSGMMDGMGFGDNTRALLITRGLAEIARLGAVLGADPLTFSGLAGVGDLIVTCTSPHSRNFRVGRLVATGSTLEAAVARLGAVAEGVSTTRAVMRHARALGMDLPVTEGVHRVLFAGENPQMVLDDLMGRSVRDDIDSILRRRRE
ncbi:MAG: NAD(P)-dependent glycerol-3-phosphate dehydrogenase [Candidatus Schekmanbacteria bacterium]|nr:NAD(P)-dependent glycerol-3-phosphate dehydrogenase [Candidatus Schekmanbacteria bacterium]